MTALLTDKPQLDYVYEFPVTQAAAAWACCQAHGFAVVKGMLDANFVDTLKAAIWRAVDPQRTLGAGQTRVRHAFCDVAPEVLALLDHPPYMDLMAHIYGTRELTIHRCAAILKNVGAPPVTWHTDWRGYITGAPHNANDVLNQGERPSGAWFYLNGTHPSRAGLAVIADSHHADWAGPAGFEFTDDSRLSFHRIGTPKQAWAELDVPGVVPLHTDPGDLILFAARTYHYASAHHGHEPRLSIGLGFRAGREPFPVPWELPAEAVAMKAAAPARYQPYLKHYTSFVNWTAPATHAPAGGMM